MNGIEAISIERQNQVAVHQYDSPHDDAHTETELLAGARCYMKVAEHIAKGQTAVVKKILEADPPKEWPFDTDMWKPNGVAKNNLKKAGAMIAAEWDRLDRMGT